MDTEDPIDTASQQSPDQRGEDRKADQIVLELIKCSASMGALLETKSLGSNVATVCEVNKSMV